MDKQKTIYKILVVEDNLGDLVLIEEYLLEYFFEIDIKNVSTFKELKGVLSTDHTYDLILLDLHLPDLAGQKLIDHVFDLASNLPIIILTGYSDIEFSIKSLSKGISDYLLKDEMNADSLYKSIRYSLGRKEVADQLKKSEKRYKDLFRLSPQPMWVIDAKTHIFLDVNHAAQSQLGYSKSEFLNLTLADVHVPMKQIEIDSLNAEFNKQEIISLKKKDKTCIYVDVKKNAITFNDVEAEIFLCVDVTERINYINAIKNRNKKLQEIAWIQSHLVRAPLTRIMGLVKIIQKYPDQKEMTLDQLLAMLSASSKELDDVVRNIVYKAEEGGGGEDTI